MQIDIERNALGVLLTPPGWAEPETPLRLASLPMRKQFKGLKIAFYAGSKAAVVVQDGHYCLMRCAGLKWLEEWIKNQMKEEKKK